MDKFNLDRVQAFTANSKEIIPTGWPLQLFSFLSINTRIMCWKQQLIAIRIIVCMKFLWVLIPFVNFVLSFWFGTCILWMCALLTVAVIYVLLAGDNSLAHPRSHNILLNRLNWFFCSVTLMHQIQETRMRCMFLYTNASIFHRNHFENNINNRGEYNCTHKTKMF